MKRVGLHLVRMTFLSTSLLATLAACDRAPPAQAAADATAPPVSAAPPPAYVPPTADQLYALVAPIALFPDRLVALTLAASTHPDLIDAARQFLGDQRNLTGSALIDAADAQPWDPSVKSLVAFPAVLDQLSTNHDWTDALGAAYANQPTDVMNAIQVMRGRAQARGTLKSSTQQTVQVQNVQPGVTDETVTEIVPAPARTIVIEPAQSNVVYVPQYDPDIVYGEPVYSRVYRTHWYETPATRGDVVTAGIVSFGAGILVGQLFASHEHHDRPHAGWDEWNTSWGRGPRGNDFHGRPSVVYDNHPYVVNRTTVINRNINKTDVNRTVNVDNRHDNGNVNIGNRQDSHNVDPRNQAPQQRPDFDHMRRPTFTASMAQQAQRAQAQPDAQARGYPAAATNRPEQRNDRPVQPEDARVANVHAVGSRPQPFDNNHTPQAPTARPHEAPRPEPQHAQNHAEAPRPQQQHERPAPRQHQQAEHPAARPQQHDNHAPSPRRDQHDKKDS